MTIGLEQPIKQPIIESQLEEDKITWDSIGIAEKTKIVAEKARGLALDITLADEIVDV